MYELHVLQMHVVQEGQVEHEVQEVQEEQGGHLEAPELRLVGVGAPAEQGQAGQAGGQGLGGQE